MFTFNPSPVFTWPVKVHVPEKGGRKIVRTFDADFKVLPPERVSELVRDSQANHEERKNSDVEILKEVVTGWKGVQDAQGQDLPFSEENFLAMVGIPYIRVAMLESYFDAVSGQKARLGN